MGWATFWANFSETHLVTLAPTRAFTSFKKLPSGANPTIASYNASVVNFYNATGSLARFENKNVTFYI
jgi:hypothetical protein